MSYREIEMERGRKRAAKRMIIRRKNGGRKVMSNKICRGVFRAQFHRAAAYKQKTFSTKCLLSRTCRLPVTNYSNLTLVSIILLC